MTWLYTYIRHMTRKLLHSFYLDPDLTAGLKVASVDEYMPQGQIVRLAIREWLESAGYVPKRPTRKGAKKR